MGWESPARLYTQLRPIPTEATFGVYKISANVTVNAEGYPVDTWAEKPNFTVMKNYYTQH
jgi:hypothetical protein